MKISKKLPIFITVFMLIIGVQFMSPKQAEAGLIPDPAMFAKEYILDTVTTLLQSRALDKMVSSTINWAVGGFDGEPGFINNWDDMLKDTQHLLLANTLDFASGVALNTISVNTQANNDAQMGCAYDASIRHQKENDSYTDNGLTVPSNILTRQAQEIEDCSNIGGITGAGSAGIKICQDEAEARYKSTIANLENDGSSFYKEAFQQATDLYNSERSSCGQGGSSSSFASNIAQSNYEAWQNGEVINARTVFKTIANEGATALNIDPLTSIIEGEGNTLKRLLGTQGQVDQFYNDIGVGGWAGYIALADPHNYPSGLQSLVSSKLSEKTLNKISKTVDDIQTPNKFLPAVDCGDAGTDDNGNCLGKAIITTLSSTKDAESSDSTKKAKEKSVIGRELSDVLAAALGKLATALLQKGFASLQTGGSGSSSEVQQNANNSFANAYQNEYDVLGLTNDEDLIIGGETTDGSSSSSTNTTTTTPNAGFQTDIYDASAPFIGGPEDEVGTDWNSGPELVIDLKEVLEPAIVNTERELDFYTEMKAALKDSQDDIIKIDRCLPGPDYNWEKRFNDLFDTTSNNDDAKENKIAFNEMKKMTTDSRINIPGADRMRSAILAILGSGNEQYDEITSITSKKQSTLAILKNIKDAIQIDFDIYKKDIHPKLPLFESQWQQLLPAEKLEIIKLPLFDEYIVVKDENGETKESVLQNNEPAVMEAILQYSWDLWRTKKGEEKPTTTEPSGTKQKSNLRYKYYIIENEISRQADVLRAEVQRDSVIENNKVTNNFLSDCIQLKSYVTGYEPSRIEESLANPFNISGGNQIPVLDIAVAKNKHGRKTYFLAVDGSKIKNSDDLISLNTGKTVVSNILRGNIANLFSSSTPSYVKSSGVRKTDADIREFLELEREKQSRKESSVFKTDIITGQGSMEGSILDFNSPAEVTEYLNNFYPQDDFPDLEITAHATSVSEIFEKDYGLATYPRGGSGTGFLYCRLQTSFDSRGQNGDQNLTNCVKDWYHTSNLDYEVIFSGI